MLVIITRISGQSVSGKGKRQREYAEWHVACSAAWHNYAKHDTWGMT